MAGETRSEIYERGLQLAEAGDHSQALDCIQQHLKSMPEDGQAWNDAGAVLYCMGNVDDAIEHFEKARRYCDASEAGEIYWNLTEAYIDGGYPMLAASLFDDMERFNILTADAINRIANIFLKQEYYGNAIESLLRSLELLPNQEILHPMIEVIRTKRAKLSVFASDTTEQLTEALDFFDKRFMLEKYIGTDLTETRNRMEWSDIAWFEGCDQTVVDLSGFPKVCETIVRLNNNDILDGKPELVNWENIDTVIVAGNSFAKDALVDKVNDIEKRTRVVTIARGIDTNKFNFTEKNRGKRLAFAGDLSAKSNLMLMLQGMQKLNYFDNDYRLYIAGEFEDASVEQYVKHSIETMGLSSVVFFDGRQDKLNNWLTDKHYIVSTSICDDALPMVLKGMACGLKPLVHNFPGAEQAMDAEFVFNISEEFCDLVLSDTYEPGRYRQIAEQNSLNAEMKSINDILVRFEKEIVAGRAIEEQQVQAVADHIESSNVSSGVADYTQTLRPAAMPVEPAFANDNAISFEPPAAIPVADVAPPAEVPIEPAATQQSQGIVEEAAAEALRASRALEALAKQPATPKQQQSWNQGTLNNVDIKQMSNTSLDASAEEQRMAQIAAEFAGIADAAGKTNKHVESTQSPFAN